MKRENLVILEDQRDTGTSQYVSDPLGRWSGTMTILPKPIKDPVVSDETFELPSDILREWKSPTYDKESFKKIRRSGRIKMTRYSTGKFSVKHFPAITVGKEITVTAATQVQVPYWGGKTLAYGTSLILDYRPGYPPYRRYVIDALDNLLRYRIDKAWGLQDVSSLPVYDLRDDLRFSTEVEDIKSTVSTALHKRWDAMTDILEGRATLTMMRSLLGSARKPLSTFKSLRDRLRKNPFKGSDRELREKWLEFRYGIMPLMYSIQDATKLLEESVNEYLTERSRTSIQLSSKEVPNRECVYIRHSGTVHINGTAKGRFKTSSSRLYSGVSLNVINSLWEVIPYSLVVDWFANVGDYLYNRTSALTPSTFDSQMCYSVKKVITTQTFARIKNQDGSFSDHLLKEEEENSYERYPFTQSDIKLVLNPKFSSWKRWLDAYALSIGPLTRALRRLK